MLLSLPTELHHHILFLLVAQHPLASLAVLRPFLAVNRALAAAARAAALHARIFRLKFDAAPVERRLYRPTPTALKEQLEYSCHILAAIRRGVPTHAERALQRDRERTADLGKYEVLMEDTLSGALLLMLDNDGRNYAQLEAAGVHAYLTAFMRTHLWEGCLENGGWPVETHTSASALWLKWLTHDHNRLLAESPTEREEFILAINPFVFLPHRYPSSEAPPNHFALPLQGEAFTYPLPNTTSTAFYPSEIPDRQYYPHYLPNRSMSFTYFGSNQNLATPLASIAAKLLFVAYRELRPFMVPGHLPRTAEDARRRWWAQQVSDTRVAAVVAALVANGMEPAQATAEAQAREPALADPLPPVPAGVTPPATLGPTQEDYHALNRGKAAALPRGARWDWESGCARAVNREQGEDDEASAAPQGESRKWDTVWWRMRLCGDYSAPRSDFAPGAVFDRGSMRGTWKGKIYIPQGNLLGMHIHLNPPYPGLMGARPNSLFTEASLGVIMQPFYLEFEEHVRMCGCTASSSHSDRVLSSLRQCGVIPVPLPVVVDWRGIPFDGVLPQDLPAGHPQHTGLPPTDADDNNDNASQHGELDSTLARDLAAPNLDYSMSNSWLPGGIGGIAFRSRPASGVPPLACDAAPVQRRDELVVSVTHLEPSLDTQAPCPAFLPIGAPVPAPPPGMFVYETYDPAKHSAHDIRREPAPYTGPSSAWPADWAGVGVLPDAGGAPAPHGEQVNPDCARCVEREKARSLARGANAETARRSLERRAARAERRARVVEGSRLLEEAMAKWGTAAGSAPPTDVSVEELDVREMGLRLDGEEEEDFDEDEDEDDENGYDSLDDFGDNDTAGTQGQWVDDGASEGGTPRRVYIPSTCDGFAHERVTSTSAPCSHAGDTLFTGETPPSGLAWGQRYTTYGRLRPWDGLVGFVRIGRSPMNFMFIFGYVVGDRTFVGEWRVAASDPMRPAWGGMLVMSRVLEGQA